MTGPQAVKQPEECRDVVVVAHRGGRFDSANSLICVKKAINYAQLNPDMRFMIEVDVHQCRSSAPVGAGPLVIIHDSVINYTTERKGRVANYTLAELQAIPMKPAKNPIPSDALNPESASNPFLLPISESDRRIPSLQETLDTLDTANAKRLAAGMIPIGIGIDFTHAATRIGRLKDHAFYPLLEKVRPGSQRHKISPPEPLLKQLAEEVGSRRGPTPIQVIGQGVHGRRHLGLLMKLLEGSPASVSIAVQASTSLFPADSGDIRAGVALDEAQLEQLIQERRFTINYNHRWDRLVHHLRRLSWAEAANPYAMFPSQVAISNRDAMARAKAAGFLTGFWTVNRAEAMRDIIRWGADMVTTDYPPIAVEVIRAWRAAFAAKTADGFQQMANDSALPRGIRYEPLSQPFDVEDPQPLQEGALSGT